MSAAGRSGAGQIIQSVGKRLECGAYPETGPDKRKKPLDSRSLMLNFSRNQIWPVFLSQAGTMLVKGRFGRISATFNCFVTAPFRITVEPILYRFPTGPRYLSSQS